MPQPPASETRGSQSPDRVLSPEEMDLGEIAERTGGRIPLVHEGSILFRDVVFEFPWHAAALKRDDEGGFTLHFTEPGNREPSTMAVHGVIIPGGSLSSVVFVRHNVGTDGRAKSHTRATVTKGKRQIGVFKSDIKA